MTDNGRHLDPPRGFHDTSPDRMAMYLTLQQEWFDTCRRVGYQPVQVPPERSRMSASTTTTLVFRPLVVPTPNLLGSGRPHHYRASLPKVATRDRQSTQ